MTAYKFDGTKDGLMCCLFRAFTEKEEPYAVFSSDFQPSFDTQVVEIKTDRETANRVAAGIARNCSGSLLYSVSYALRSGEPLKETIIFKALKKCLAAKKDITTDYSDYDMLSFFDLKAAIGKEIHRMKGFLRFKECDSGVLYAHFTPDNNICDLIAPHFAARFPSQRFVIHDVKRNIVSLFDGKEIKTVPLLGGVTVFLSEDEKDISSLWKTYISSVTIRERKNIRAQDNFLPRRYRKNMTEFL